MKNDFRPTRLNVENFARAGGSMVSDERLAHFPRLLEETRGLGAEIPVAYSVRGEMRSSANHEEQVWLLVAAQTVLPLACQRCLGPVDVPVTIERAFRFVATEALAAEQDELSQEDVLALNRSLDVLELIEEEFLMSLPVLPKHEICPEPLPMKAVDSDFVEDGGEKRNPFAVLEKIRKKPEA